MQVVAKKLMEMEQYRSDATLQEVLRLKPKTFAAAASRFLFAVEKGANIVSLPGKTTNEDVGVTLHHLFPIRVFQLSLWDPVLQRLRRGCS